MDDTPCTYRISAKAIIRDDRGRVLLIREKDGSWELPGGGIEHGEDPKKALAREIAEETGFTVVWVAKQPEAFWTLRKEVGSPVLRWFAVVAYAVKVSGEFKPGLEVGDEAYEARYFAPEEVKTLRLHVNTKPYFLGPHSV